ncbi:MAG: SDR family oxidoreductase [Dehalococcoidia bacterium]|nr:MAG: SDR family oxidoreductase [Dehalococcoidia bacterium]
MLLADRVAIITGGAKGIGKGIALKFAAEGCAVVIADIDQKSAGETLAQITKKGGKGIALACDALDDKQVRAAVDKAISHFDKVDILVNNAGGMPAAPTPIEDMPEADWDKVLTLNLKSLFLFSKAVVPHMKKQKYGRIINLSSAAAVNPPAHCIHYHTAKMGIIGFTLDLAHTLAPFNICVNVLLPGPVRTDFYDPMLGKLSEKEKDAFFDELGKGDIPLQRTGTPEDVAGAALFLASELASYVTGDALLVSGGSPLRPIHTPIQKTLDK